MYIEKGGLGFNCGRAVTFLAQKRVKKMRQGKGRKKKMSMATSLASATIVGALKDHFKNFTIEKITMAGAWGIDRDAQEGGFWNFPNKPLTLVSFRVFDPREPKSSVKRHYFLMLKEDLYKPEVLQEVEDILTEQEKEREVKEKKEKDTD